MSEIWIPESFRERPYAKKHFEEIVKWSMAYHPFYRQHIKNPAEEIPLLTRDIATDNNDLLLNGHKETGRTSGSTGVPVRISWSSLKVERERMVNRQFLTWMQGTLPRVRLVGQRECADSQDALDVCSPLQEQLDFIQKRKRLENIKALITYPSNAANLSAYIIEQKIDMSFIERVVCYAECFDQSHLKLIKQAFPLAKIWTTYSCSEVGFIASICPFNNNYHHIVAQNVGVEVLNELGQPCVIGEVGRLVVTDFFNRHSPFIRYALGDLAISGECPCGQIHTPALQAILGKVRGSLKRQDGSPIMFANIAVTLRDLPGLRQYQVIQESIDFFRFRYIMKKGFDEAQLQLQIRKALFEYLGFQPEIIFVKEVQIEREPSGKFYASICKA